ncbi:MAG TPA: DUF2269 domain-containing protein [Terriglobales bacterium]|nr:DUF2269 domain-containing protein [Terriglobales bacterium]
MLYDLVKTLHILTATWLFGAGCSTAFHMLRAWRSGEAGIIRYAARSTVLADWLFTAIPGILQPVTGIALIVMAGIDPWSSWLVAAYGLFVLALVCWLQVAAIQIRLARGTAAIGADDRAAFRRWLILGCPGFSAVLIIFYLMVAKPALW